MREFFFQAGQGRTLQQPDAGHFPSRLFFLMWAMADFVPEQECQTPETTYCMWAQHGEPLASHFVLSRWPGLDQCRIKLWGGRGHLLLMIISLWGLQKASQALPISQLCSFCDANVTKESNSDTISQASKPSFNPKLPHTLVWALLYLKYGKPIFTFVQSVHCLNPLELTITFFKNTLNNFPGTWGQLSRSW